MCAKPSPRSNDIESKLCKIHKNVCCSFLFHFHLTKFGSGCLWNAVESRKKLSSLAALENRIEWIEDYNESCMCDNSETFRKSIVACHRDSLFYSQFNGISCHRSHKRNPIRINNVSERKKNRSIHPKPNQDNKYAWVIHKCGSDSVCFFLSANRD